MKQIVLAAALVLGVVLVAGCQPIRYRSDGSSSATSEFRVHRATSATRAGIEIRLRDCDSVDFAEASDDTVVASRDLRPWAKVTRDGRVVYTDAPRPPGTYAKPSDTVRPAGSTYADNGPGSADVIFVPMSSLAGTVQVTAGCTDQPATPRPGSFDWTIGWCTLVDGACGPVKGGSGVLTLPMG